MKVFDWYIYSYVQMLCLKYWYSIFQLRVEKYSAEYSFMLRNFQNFGR